jgi:hypothetical protein
MFQIKIRLLCLIQITVIIVISNTCFLVFFEELALILQYSKPDTSDYQNYIITEFVTELQIKLYHIFKQEYITTRKR